MQMPAQFLPLMIHWGSKFNSDMFNILDITHTSKSYKPWVGLWASPLMSDDRTAWEEHCTTTRLRHSSLHRKDTMMQEVTPTVDCRVFAIQSDADRDYLMREYGGDYQRGIDWGLVSEDYDAVYCEGDGIWAMCKGGWDLESIVFFNDDTFTVKECTA